MSQSDNNAGLTPIGGGLRPIGDAAAPPAGAPPPGGGSSSMPSLQPVAAPPGNIGGVAPLGPPQPLRPPVPIAAPGGGMPPAPPTTPVAPPISRPPVSAYAADEDDSEEKHKRIVTFIAGASVAIVAVILFFMLRIPPPVPAPTGYTKFTSGDNTWACDAPQGWAQKASGAASGDPDSVGLNGVFFTSGNAKIEVTMGDIAHLIAAQLVFGSALTPEAMTGSRANGAHKISRKAASQWLRGYAEHNVTGDDIPNGMGGVFVQDFGGIGSNPSTAGADTKKAIDALMKDTFKSDAKLSEYTATGNYWGLGGKVHGYRATMVGNKLIATVVCQCSERDWPKLKPAFLHVMNSVHESQKPDSKDSLSVPGAGSVRMPGVGM